MKRLKVVAAAAAVAVMLLTFSVISVWATWVGTRWKLADFGVFGGLDLALYVALFVLVLIVRPWRQRAPTATEQCCRRRSRPRSRRSSRSSTPITRASSSAR